MNVSPSSIIEGDDARLTWDSTNVNQVRIDQGIGYVERDGSRRVSPGVGTYTYHGTFYGNNGNTISCSATLRVRAQEQPLVFNGFTLDALPQVTPQPLTYVSLASLPYTGLDLGPWGTAVYWLMLILWSLAVAYVLLGGVVPFALKRAGVLGSQIGEAINQEPPHTPAPEPAHSSAHVMHAAPVAAPVRSRPGSYHGFKTYAQDGGTLTIDDIVKGLSRAPMAEEPVGPPMPPVIPVAAPAPAPQVASVPHEVPGFIAALLEGQREQVFAVIRDINKAGGDTEAFLTQVTMALDDAYRAKTTGTPVHPEVARVCENCAPNFLERVISSLATAVDSTYSAGVTGVKLALTRALHVIEG
jgi:hypothetical protein